MKLALLLSAFLFLTVTAMPAKETTDVLSDSENTNTAQGLDNTLSANGKSTAKNEPQLVSDFSKQLDSEDTMNEEDTNSNSEHVTSAGESTGTSSEKENSIDSEQRGSVNEVESDTNEHTNFQELNTNEIEAEVSEEKKEKGQRVSTSEIAPYFRNVWGGINKYFYTSQVHIGRNTGSFRTCNVNGAHASGRFISSMKVFYYTNFIRGIIFEFTDGVRTWSYGMGTCTGYYTDTFYLQLGERLTTLNIYGVKYGSYGYFGGFYLRTDHGRSFAAYPIRGEQHGPFRVPIGSGVLASVVGRHYSSYLYSLGFQMLNRVNKIKVVGVIYPGLLSSVPLHPMKFHTITYDNTKGRTDQHYVLKDCKTMRRSHEWYLDYGRALEVHFGDIMQFIAHIPVLHPSSTSTGSLQYGISTMHSRNDSGTEHRCYEFPVTVPAGQSMTMSAVLYSGSYTTRYRGDYDIYYESGRYHRIRQLGYFHGVTPSKIVAKLQ